MTSRTLIRRYTRGLVSALADWDEYNTANRQLDEFRFFLADQDQLRDVLFRPILPATRKKAIGVEVLKKLAFVPKVRRFLLLLIENSRLELLPEILQALPDMWNAEQGVAAFEVSSVVELSQSQKDLLAQKLEKMERKPVSLTYKINPDLIGGVSIRQGHIVYDASLRGALTKLQDIISEGSITWKSKPTR